MLYYALQVQTGKEARYLAIARRRIAHTEESLLWPRRRLRIRRSGQWKESLAPLFPGYLFLRAELSDDPLWNALRTIPGFIRFLPANDRIAPLDERDQSTLTHFLAFGEIVDRSLVTFDENKRIRVISGPLQGLEGQIVKVDRRKGRAKVRLDIYDESFEIDFGFQTLELSTEKASGASPS